MNKDLIYVIFCFFFYIGLYLIFEKIRNRKPKTKEQKKSMGNRGKRVTKKE